MNIDLSPALEKFVQGKVTSGTFDSAADVVRTALILMEEQEAMLALDKEEIRAMIEEGWQSLQRGEVVDGETFFAEMEAELEALIKAEKAEKA